MSLTLRGSSQTSSATLVRHGSSATTARPTNAGMVIWSGSVRPSNMVSPDIWVEELAGVAPVSDDFNRVDAATLGTADSGHVWTSGLFGITSNRAQSTGSTQAVVDYGSADATITAKVVAHGGGSAGIVFRYVDASNYFGVTTTLVFKRVGGVLTNFAAFDAGATIAAGDTCRVTVSGSTITVFRQAASTGSFVQVATYTDTSLATATKHGLRASAANGQIDTFRIDAV